MLSFINMGSRKKRQRKKRGDPTIRTAAGASSTRGNNRRVSRGSGSFMSPGPGNIGEFAENRDHDVRPRPVLKDVNVNGRNAVMERTAGAGAASTEAPINTIVPKRSPEIQMEFKHDSLLQSLPKDFIRCRKGSSSSSPSLREASVARSSSQVPDWASSMDNSPQGRRFTQERRRMAPLPSVAPIKIPASPVRSVSTRSRRKSPTARRRSGASNNSPAWASDSEISPVSGLSAARDVLAGTFSFSGRTTGFSETSKEKEIGTRMTRQDSATLPRDAVWESAVRSPSVSRKSSTHSVKKRKLDSSAVDLPPFDAFILTSPHLRKGVANGLEKAEKNDKDAVVLSAPPRKDSIAGHRRDGSLGKGPPPPGLTPSAQKLDHADQAALHRVSRILETDAEAATVFSSQPPSSSTGSFSSPSKQTRATQRTPLGSPFKLPSALSTPSTYSKYTVSPYASPGMGPVFNLSGAGSAKSDEDYGSFLEDFDFVGPSSGPSSRGDRSGYSGSADSPYETQVPMTAASVSSVIGMKSAPVMGSSGFPRGVSRHHPPLRKMGSVETNASYALESSAYSSSSAKAEGPPARSGVLPIRQRKGSVSSTDQSSGKSSRLVSDVRGDSRNVATAQNYTFPAKNAASRDASDQGRSGPARQSPPPLKLKVSSPKDSGGDRPRPSPRFHITNADPSLSSASPPPSPLSARSPDLFDMIIPNGHIVTPISQRQVRRKRSGSIPRPIKITPPRSDWYVPTNGDEDDEAARGGECCGEPDSECVIRIEDALSTGGTQTFPETPTLFSPDLWKDALSRSNSVLSAANQPHAAPRSLMRNVMAFQPIVVPTTPRVAEPTEGPSDTSAESDHLPVKSELNSNSQPVLVSNSPPISPLQPPPCSPVAPIPKVQTLTDVPRPSPPLLGPVSKKRPVHVRPPLPFGPRQPNASPRKGVAPLSFFPRRSASEGAPRIPHSSKDANFRPNKSSETPPATPSFKTTPVPWRSLPLDAAKWTFSSAQLQAIVRTAIEQSAQASSIRLLPHDVFEELPDSLRQLEARRLDVQNDYKVMVRRRRSIIDRLAFLSSGTAPKQDVVTIMRNVDELGSLTAAGDKLTEQLHDIDDQITQVHRLRDVHQASALAVALRKLNASLLRQISETQNLQATVTNLYAERNEAWRKAEDLERELDDAVNDSAERGGVARFKSVSSSRRSSRVSLARKNSSRTSKAGLRLSQYSCRRSSNRSSGSSLYVHHSASVRSTFSSDIVPPVPPLPHLDQPMPTGTTGLPSSHPSIASMPQSSALHTSDRLYNALYDLLGVKAPDRPLPSPGRPHSAIYTTSPLADDNNNNNNDQAQPRGMDGKLIPPSFPGSLTRLRSGSLPTLVPSPRNELEETGAIMAVLDFYN